MTWPPSPFPLKKGTLLKKSEAFFRGVAFFRGKGERSMLIFTYTGDLFYFFKSFFFLAFLSLFQNLFQFYKKFFPLHPKVRGRLLKTAFFYFFIRAKTKQLNNFFLIIKSFCKKEFVKMIKYKFFFVFFPCFYTPAFTFFIKTFLNLKKVLLFFSLKLKKQKAQLFFTFLSPCPPSPCPPSPCPPSPCPPKGEGGQGEGGQGEGGQGEGGQGEGGQGEGGQGTGSVQPQRYLVVIK